MANELLADLSRELLEMAKAARTEAAQTGSDYDKGRHYAMYEVISLLIEQAKSVGTDLSSLGLQNVDPERDILSL